MLVVTLAAIERGGDEVDPADDFPNLTTTFVSPRNGFSIKHPDGGGTVTPAKQLWGSASRSTTDSMSWRPAWPPSSRARRQSSGPVRIGTMLAHGQAVDRIDEWVDDRTSRTTYVLPGGCGVPRSQQAEITIDGQSGRIAECPNQIEATVVAGGRLYLFTLSHDRSDARAVFDAFVATIDLTPETAVDFPAMTTTFVSPTYGYSFKYHDRGGLAPATELWDPVNQPLDDVELRRPIRWRGDRLRRLLRGRVDTDPGRGLDR